MNLQTLIPSEKIVLLDSAQKDKMDLLSELLSACLADTQDACPRDVVWNALKERELSMSTGIGHGVAIPHCSTDQVEEILALLALVKEGIEFDSVDGKPVHIIVLLIIPRGKGDVHIKTMAAVANLLNNQEFRREVLEASSPTEAYAAIEKYSR